MDYCDYQKYAYPYIIAAIKNIKWKPVDESKK